MNDEYQSAKVFATPLEEENHKDRFNNVSKPFYSFDKYALIMDLDLPIFSESREGFI